MKILLYHSSAFADSELKKEDRLRAIKAVNTNHSLFILCASHCSLMYTKKKFQMKIIISKIS